MPSQTPTKPILFTWRNQQYTVLTSPLQRQDGATFPINTICTVLRKNIGGTYNLCEARTPPDLGRSITTVSPDKLRPPTTVEQDIITLNSLQ